MITEGEDTISVYHAAKRRCFYNGHVQHRHTVNAVLFDLDDTLFDHEQAARAALASVHRSHKTFTLWPFDAFEQAHARALEELHVDVLTGDPGPSNTNGMSIACAERRPHTERPTSLRGGLSRGRSPFSPPSSRASALPS